MLCIFLRSLCLNSVWHSDAIGSGNGILPDGTPHYLNQCWIIISEVWWYDTLIRVWKSLYNLQLHLPGLNNINDVRIFFSPFLFNPACTQFPLSDNHRKLDYVNQTIITVPLLCKEHISNMWPTYFDNITELYRSTRQDRKALGSVGHIAN